MNKKQEKTCNGYEAMFTFLSEEDFQKHLRECESCAKEHEKMQKISALIQEAKPYIKEKQKQNRILKSAAAFFVVAFAALSIPVYMAGANMYDNLVAQNTLTAQELGFPVDEYGLLYVE